MAETSGELEQKLMGILSDPNAIAGIMNVIKGLGVGSATQTASAESTADLPPVAQSALEIIPTVAQTSQIDRTSPRGGRLADDLGLLYAIKPFLSEERAQKVIRLLRF